jgi:hypothetical protein
MRSSSAENPTAPESAAPTDLSPYYCLNTARVTFRELRHCSSGIFGFGALAGAKILQLKLRSVIVTEPQCTRIVDLAEVPSEVLEHLADTSAALQSEGLGPRFALVMPTIGNGENVTVIHVNRARTILASVAFHNAGSAADIVVEMISLWSDGHVVGATNAWPQLSPPPGFQTVYRIGASVGELVNWHQAFLTKITRGRPLELDEVAQRQLLLDNWHHAFEHHRQRGVWSQLSWAQVEKIAGKSRATKTHEPAAQAWR